MFFYKKKIIYFNSKRKVHGISSSDWFAINTLHPLTKESHHALTSKEIEHIYKQSHKYREYALGHG